MVAQTQIVTPIVEELTEGEGVDASSDIFPPVVPVGGDQKVGISLAKHLARSRPTARQVCRSVNPVGVELEAEIIYIKARAGRRAGDAPRPVPCVLTEGKARGRAPQGSAAW